jgi:hypothetical protein
MAPIPRSLSLHSFSLAVFRAHSENGVSVAIHPGESVALVGQTGAGLDSTLPSLPPRAVCFHQRPHRSPAPENPHHGDGVFVHGVLYRAVGFLALFHRDIRRCHRLCRRLDRLISAYGKWVLSWP